MFTFFHILLTIFSLFCVNLFVLFCSLNRGHEIESESGQNTTDVLRSLISIGLALLRDTCRDKTNPNNYRGINLMDIISKIMSRIMNTRLFKILDKHGENHQFGGTPGLGCRGGIFSLKTLLHTRRNHGKSTYVAFIDLVKSYDIANHKLRIEVLENMEFPLKYAML